MGSFAREGWISMADTVALDPEVVRLALMGRTAIYGALYGAFANEPSTEMLKVLRSEELRLWVETLMGEEGAVLLDDVLGCPASEDALACAYTRLFVGPARPEAGPWESLYRGKEATLFCQTTLDVRRCYVEEGLIPQGYPHVADDHIALELDYMRRLGERAVNAWETGDEAVLRETLEASRRFVDEHLKQWVQPWTDALEAAPHGMFYRELGALLAAYVSRDRQLVGELTEQVAPEE